jgi:hypothetical protein
MIRRKLISSIQRGNGMAKGKERRETEIKYHIEDFESIPEGITSLSSLTSSSSA